jgi:hypothetical protein
MKNSGIRYLLMNAGIFFFLQFDCRLLIIIKSEIANVILEKWLFDHKNKIKVANEIKL